MNQQNQRFLELYREYENVLKEQGRNYFDMNETAETVFLKDRMTITRQMRNFLVHADGSDFLVVSDEQLLFLKDLIELAKRDGDTVDKHMVPIKQCVLSVTDVAYRGLVLSAKHSLQWFIVLNEQGHIKGLCSLSLILKAYVKDSKQLVGSIRGLCKSYVLCGPKVLLSELRDTVPAPTEHVIVTSDGTPFGKCLGLYQIPSP